MLFVFVLLFINFIPEHQCLEFSYQGAGIVFNYTVNGQTKTVGSFDEDLGVFGSESPKVNVSGYLVLPNDDIYGCSSKYFNAFQNQSWIALVARGQCKFDEKINNALERNASAIIVFDYPDGNWPLIMSHKGAEKIVAIAIQNELGNSVGVVVQNGGKVYASIRTGKAYRFNKDIQFERTSIIFVSVSFLILMVVSLAWLIFYYVQKFRLMRNLSKSARRQKEMFVKALALMPIRTLKRGDDLLKVPDSLCAICIEPYTVEDVVRELPCKHCFHKHCVDPWISSKQTCPMCKVNVLKSLEINKRCHVEWEETGGNNFFCLNKSVFYGTIDNPAGNRRSDWLSISPNPINNRIRLTLTSRNISFQPGSSPTTETTDDTALSTDRLAV